MFLPPLARSHLAVFDEELALVEERARQMAAAGVDAVIVQVRRHGRAFNYGFDRVRYPMPVRAGDRIRLHMHVLAADSAPGGTMLRRRYTMELEGAAKPAMVAEMLSLIVE